MRAWRLPLLIFFGIGAAVGFLILVLGPIAMWASPTTGLRGIDKANVINATRQILLAGTAGIVVLAGGIFTARTYYLSRRGQLTDRYTNAITLLASDKLTERIGGVYALEHLMIESEREHETVIEVLAAFVRESTGATPADDSDWNAEHHHGNGGDDSPRLETDVQAAMTVIGRRPRRPERNDVDLSLTDLCGADLSRLNFDGVWFWRAKLRSVKLFDTSLKGANFAWAQLQDAGLADAEMQDAFLAEAQLQEAVLMGAQLQYADLSNANLQGAYLAGANLKGAKLNNTQLKGADLVAYPTGKPHPPVRNLTASQLATAIIDETTRLPDGLRKAIISVSNDPAESQPESQVGPKPDDSNKPRR
jgi:uncharacterized protein YjbI with pentapeptide repeats